MGGRTRSAAEPAFLAELRALGVPPGLTVRLRSFLRRHHPGEQGRIYHGYAHTCEVAGLTARMLASWPRVPADRKILLILASALHDVDPRRRPNTAPRVSGTLRHLASDATARRLLSDFGSRFGFTPAQASALIMATDYSPSPAEMARKRAAFQRARRAAFGRDPWISEWGRRLAYWDQIATYLRAPEDARRRVAGLARELRAEQPDFRPGEGMREMSRRFLAHLRRDPLFHYLPPEDRRRFDAASAELTRVRRRARRRRAARTARRAVRRPAR
jgi:hypothetical protein